MPPNPAGNILASQQTYDTSHSQTYPARAMSVETLSTKAQVQVQVHDTTETSSWQVQVQVPCGCMEGCMDIETA